MGSTSIEDFRSLLTATLLTQAAEDNFNNSNSMKTGKELKLEYMENDVRIVERCFNPFIKLNIDIYKLNLLHYISLPGFSFACFLKQSEVEIETIQDERQLKDIIIAMRGGICGVIFNRCIKSQSQSQSQSLSHSQSQRSIWYIDANNLM